MRTGVANGMGPERIRRIAATFTLDVGLVTQIGAEVATGLFDFDLTILVLECHYLDLRLPSRVPLPIFKLPPLAHLPAE